ncbi:NUDIX hydrolase [Candidatus Halobonum tyrrellensis]|uniref:ADP-ribose pyrophosphatase n=1 Tax=Candidatus Halobonum tyrrellensis G22 TaxID=1324957 RepID=V4H9A9_9EURY|nr:NUDIX hydrolase [Candidatus Halobonum tyrrellensis]ESP87290.1 ADP-ribose pyrophosphatase [Candidatus Halobonum tyrrellensis G22]
MTDRDEAGTGGAGTGTERDRSGNGGRTAADGGRAADGNDAPAFDDGRRHDWPGDPEWPVVDSAVEYETGWVTAGYDLVEQPDGSTKRYYWAELATAVVVVARADDSIAFVEQYRPTVRGTQTELPAGVVEAGESFTAAAERELEEETGFRAGSTSLLQTLWCSTGLLRHRRAFVFAEDLTPVEQSLDDNEFLTPRAVPVDDAVRVAREEPTNDATVEGVLLAADEGLL